MKKIEIGGQERPVLYGINALSDFNEGTGTSLDWIFRMMGNPLSMNMNQLRWLIYVGLKQGAEESNITIDFDVKTVGKWLDKDFNKFTEFMEALKDGLPGASKNDDPKKK
jgi:hypothetical protein